MLRWIGLAVLGILIAAAISIAASRLASQQIGLASEPISAGDALAPKAGRETGPRHIPSNAPTPKTPAVPKTSSPGQPASPVPSQPAVPTPSAPETTTTPEQSDDYGGNGGGESGGADD